MQKKPAIKFPKRFLWGVATSAHQVEGGTHNQWSVWELEHAKILAAKAEYHLADLDAWPDIKTQAKDPVNYVSGRAADHYERYEEDFQIVKKLGLGAFRYSIEWSRVEPEEGKWNAEAIAHYRRYTRRLRELGVEPVVTLFHFTLPVWFAQLGGFEKRRNVKYFVRFVEKIINELGSDVKLIVTLNEPTVYAAQSYHEHQWPPAYVRKKLLTLRVVNNLAYAHNQAAKAIHALGRYKVMVAHNSAYYYPGDDAWLSRVSANVMQYVHDDYFLRKVRKHSDILGVNYYFSNRVYGYRVHNPMERVSDLGWDLNPAHLEYALERLHRKYNLPILITEAGVADQGDEQRQWLITQHIMAMQRAMGHGVDLRGYLHWSLLDNFEWAYGKWPRFGLVAVDCQTQQRTVRKSGLWYGRIVKKLRQE